MATTSSSSVKDLIAGVLPVNLLEPFHGKDPTLLQGALAAMLPGISLGSEKFKALVGELEKQGMLKPGLLPALEKEGLLKETVAPGTTPAATVPSAPDLRDSYPKTYEAAWEATCPSLADVVALKGEVEARMVFSKVEKTRAAFTFKLLESIGFDVEGDKRLGGTLDVKGASFEIRIGVSDKSATWTQRYGLGPIWVFALHAIRKFETSCQQALDEVIDGYIEECEKLPEVPAVESAEESEESEEDGEEMEEEESEEETA